ncbi:MAG: hypothetical protein J6D38_07910 [Solobacterium sp.]|nr:hypothetical protein [Solobacterium sp.]
MRRITLLLTLVLLTGCGTPVQEEPVPSATAETAPVNTAADTEYSALIEKNEDMENYTAGIKLQYDMEYENGSKSVYDLDGVMEEDGSLIHLTQHLNADGIQSDTEGWYDGSRLYMTYNNVNYYEDMDAAAVRQIMLVPVKPFQVNEKIVSSQEVNTADTETEYVFHLNTDSAKSVFDSRYDIYGVNQYDTYQMEQGTITQAFGTDGTILREETAFQCTVTVKGIGVVIHVTSSVNYLNISDTHIAFTEDQKKQFAEYVNFMDIDTSQISDADVTADYAEATPIETLKKRLKHRLNYTEKSEGVYTAEFNETESYTFDFNTSIFTYSNRTSHYIYNWRGDVGGFGDTCTVDFATGTVTEDCDESVVKQMTAVKNYFLMELYYCGLSLDEIQNGSKE